MKRLLLLLLFIPCMLSAQDVYSDMLVEGKTWNFIRWPYGNTRQEGMRGDTIVNGQTCKKFGYVNKDGTFDCSAVFRQEGDKVYVKHYKSNEFSLAYDFGAKTSDVITIGLARIEVTETGTVSARGHELRRITYKVIEFNDGNEWIVVEGNYGGSWIEGIGGSTGPMTEIPVPDFAGNYDNFTDISLGDELLCDVNIFYDSGYEKMMLTYKPEWTYTKQIWDEMKGNWGDPVECHAKKTGMELPPPGNFPYTTVTIEEEQESKLLLRGNDQVYAEKNCFLEYMSKAFPGINDVFTELAYYPLDVVLYDFTLDVGDRYPCRGEVTVEEISWMTTRDGISRKLFRLSNGLLLLEGVGCLNSRYGVFGYQNDPGINGESEVAQAPQSNEPPADNTILSFLKYGDNTEPVYILGDWEMGVEKVEKSITTSSDIYDLEGRRLNGTPRKGVYIQNGKKRVVK